MQPNTMITGSRLLNVLLIQAPGHHPVGLSMKAEALTAKLASLGPHVQCFDAGTDFLEKVVGPDGLKTGWPQLPKVLGRLRCPDGSRPQTILSDLKALDLALDIVSAAYPPVRLRRDGCSFPQLGTIDELLAFGNDPDANPYWQYAFEKWEPFASSQVPDLAVICLESAGQMPAAATLAMAWHRRWPGIALLGVGMDNLSTEGHKKVFNADRLAAAAADVRALADQVTSITNQSQIHTAEAPAGRPAGCRPLLELPLIADRIPEYAQTAVRQGRKLIIWRPGSGDAGTIGRNLHAVARLGIWNHLILDHGQTDALGKFARANANIVHSWCRLEPALTPFSDPVRRYPSSAPAYGETAPMPGLPLWMAMRDPIYIRSCLEHYDLATLMRLRIRDDGHGLFEVGQNVRYHYVRPEELPAGYLEEIVRMVSAGGSVNARFVKYNLERAYLIAYAEEEGVIIGDSSLKHPRDEYIDAVSRQSGIDLHAFLERGYTSVRPEYRGLGIGAQLLAGLTERAGGHKIFSVIAEGNIATQKMAMRNRTRRVATFFSQRANKQVSVWIPEWMLPEGVDLPEQPDV